jgi:hypothetical protein
MAAPFPEEPVTPLTREDADRLLAEAPLLPYAKAGLAEGRAMVEVLLARGVPALVRRPDDCCGGGGCGPSFEVMVREEDVPHIASLQRERWEEALAREGLAPVAAAAAAVGEAEEPPCPACGTVGPLVQGACGDCGLQLE